MEERAIIEAAFADLLRKIFEKFNGEYTLARGDAAAEKLAEEAFRKGLMHARHLRSRALALLE